jgi:hypothetical protein
VRTMLCLLGLKPFLRQLCQCAMCAIMSGGSRIRIDHKVENNTDSGIPGKCYFAQETMIVLLMDFARFRWRTLRKIRLLVKLRSQAGIFN